MNLMKSRLFAMIAAIVAAVALMAVGAGGAAAAPKTGEMFLTFVRHGESAGNSSGLIDTSVPGPGLTETGRAQAAAVAQLLADCKFDGVYASTMVRTQQTAEPTSQLCGHSTVVEEGLHEIEAGVYEGTPEKDAREGYLAAPIQWLQGNLDARIPGSINGHEFKKRMDDSLQDIQDRGHKRGDLLPWRCHHVLDADVRLEPRHEQAAVRSAAQHRAGGREGHPREGLEARLVGWSCRGLNPTGSLWLPPSRVDHRLSATTWSAAALAGSGPCACHRGTTY
ncbi:histidine phosphatase family protein [Nocardia cyriacigeorgica]|uniref:histidine phosphatase family protein n=1 Tax=Nocardia cyriacigeorgica TaxID=135487 RepID=UPI00351780BA